MTKNNSKMQPSRKYVTNLGLLSLAVVVFALVRNHFDTKIPMRTLKNEDDRNSDVIILGGGHTGLSAALTLYRHQHDVVIFDTGKPRNLWDTPTHAFSGWENKKTSDFKTKSRNELKSTGFVRFIDQEVISVEKNNDSSFEVMTASGEQWQSKKLLLAMGTEFVFPNISGYVENFPSNILHCLFTFGFDKRGSSSAGIIAMGHAASPFHTAILVEDALKFAKKVTVYTNGDSSLVTEVKKMPGGADASYDSRIIKGFVKNPKGSSGIFIEFEDKEALFEDFLVHQPATRVNQGIVKQLGLELDVRGDIATKPPFWQTTTSGVFAAGDCASPFKIISNALLMGANAGAGIARELPRRVTHNSVDRLANNV
ncbi:hypothetical protein OCU04_000195 [Sclerotinia nivalis]|uniref:FAD/NAD(P)-binding domain-containing protein n=1 Tax=Sclerotinia nivalis TaxID=352851 RepID=A0A9X0AVL6_9HELO|nr:hypothetical protein OCU04_000195 [Sclerotinia nivalis]